MRIVDLYKMSEEERKKALEEQQSLYNERMRQSEEIGRQANQQFNDLISKQGEYDTSKHTTTIGDLRKAYKGSNSFQTVNNSLNNYSKNNSPSIWEKMGYIMDNFGTGVHQGTVGIAQGLFTDSANEMQKGKAKNNNELFNNFINAYAGNDLHHIAQSTLNTINEGINILNDKDKNLWQKMVDINLNTVSNGAKALLPMQGFYSSANQVIGKVSDTDQQLLEMNKNISEPLEERKKELANKGEEYDGATKFLGEAGQVIGNMIPSITASAITKNPSVALGVMGASVKGQATQEALDKGMSLDKATQIGDAKALIEVATEKLSGGTKVFGHGSLDDIAEELVRKGAKSKAGKFIMTQLLNAGGEIAEEEISNVLGNAIDKGTTDPDKKVLDMKEAFETMGSTAFTTTMLNLLTGGMVNDYRQISNNMNQYKDANTGEILDNNSQDILKQAENIINENSTPNLQQQSTQNEQILPIQQINQEQNNVVQNENINEFNGYTDKEINNIESNKITVAKSNEDIINFVNSSKKVPSNRKMYLGKIKENISNYINEKFGINIGNYNISLKTDAIRHTENNHTNLEKETSRGQIPLVAEDYANIPVIINNPDNVSIDGKTQQGKPVIKFEKNIDGNNVAVTYVSDKHNNLELQTMYKFKNNKKMNPATASNELNSLNRTSETNSGTDSFINNSIPPISNKVNSDTITNNYTQSNENNTQNEPTKGETINWNEIERPEGKIRKHYRSIIESSNTTKEAKAIARELMGSDTYVPESNKQQLNEADRRIQTNGADNELTALTSMSNRVDAKITANDIAVGERLIEYYSKIGDKAKLQEAIQTTAMAGTQAGQTVQALSLLNHQTPQGQVTWIQRSVDKMNQELVKKRGKNAQQFNFTPDMQQKIMEANTQEEMYKALDEVYEELGQQVSKSRLEQIDSWRYFSMLANPKTHIRNIVGNVAMGKLQSAKNKIAGAIEGTVAQFNPNMERTHTLKPASKEVRSFAKNDISNVADRLELNDNKYNPKSRLENSMRTFKSDAMENTLGKAFELNEKALEVEDAWGLKSGYVKALSEYMTANNLKPKTITDAQLAKARNYAIAEAKEATFHSENAIATAINQFSRKNKVTKGITDAVLPFVKTPMNVAKGGMEYNPTGLIKTLTYDTVQLRKGNISVNKYIDNLSKGLTGTGVAILGYAMAEAGILKASGGDDEKKEKFDEALGKQSYSLEINGKTYSLDWLAPVGIPLFVGAEAHNINEAGKEEVKNLSELGQYGKGNIDLWNRPKVVNEDGSISTVRSMSFEENGKEILVPTVVNGKIVSDEKAIEHYYKTGEYLGKFNSIKEADEYAEKLHEEQESLYTTSKKETKSSDNNQKSKKIIESLENWANAMTNSMSPMAEMSMISGLTSALKSYDQDSTKMLGTIGTNAVKSYVNQFVPTALGQVARTVDDYERSTTSTAKGILPKAIDQTKLQMMSKIPGLRQTLPIKTDVWGKEQKQEGNIVEKAVKNAILPFNIKSISNSKVDKALNELYGKTGSVSILPTTSLDKTFKIDGQTYRMTNEEYNKYRKYYGQNSYKLLNDLVSSSTYKGLNNEQKQKAIESIYSYTKEKNKVDYAKNNKLKVEPSTLYNTMEDLKKNGGNQSLYLNYTARTTGIEKERDKNKVLASANYDDKTKSIIYLNGTGKDDKLYNNIKNSNININQYLTYKIEESEDKFLADKDSNGKSISGTAKKKVYDYVNSNITGYNNKLLVLGQKYKLTKSEQENLAKYINQISNNSSERNSLFEYYSKNFTIKDGKVYYK